MNHQLIRRMFDEHPSAIVLVSAFDDTIEYLNHAWTHSAGVASIHAGSPGKSIATGLPADHPIMLALRDQQVHCLHQQDKWLVASALPSEQAQHNLILAGCYPVQEQAQAQQLHAQTTTAVMSALNFECLADDLDSIAHFMNDALTRCAHLTEALVSSLNS